MSRRVRPLLPVLSIFVEIGSAHAERPDWQHLRGQPIAALCIEAREVFDPTRPEEDHLLFAWANAVHVRTRDDVIRREMLQKEGDPFEPLRIEESERNLRALGIFQDVLIEATEAPTGVLLTVHTSDRWSAKLRTDVSRRGGISQLELGLEDTNLLGRAILLGGSFVSSTDVNAAAAGWRDPRFFGTRWDVSYDLHHDELERRHRANLTRPFFSESVRWSAGLDAEDTRGERRLFEAGAETDRVHIHQGIYEGWVAVHGHQQLLSRWALFGARRHLRGEEHNDIAAVGLAWARLHREYWRLQNLDLFGVGEDVATGWTLQLGGGSDLVALGADHDRPFWRMDAAWARFVAPATLVGVAVREHAFVHAGGIENSRIAAEAFGFWQKEPFSTFAWRLGAAGILDEPGIQRFTLGGDENLRGYEARHLSGTRILYLNTEERLFTGWRILFLRLGGVAFVDAAAAWDAGEALDRSDARLGAGFGLRLANNKAGSGVTGIDVGFGTNSIQISVANGSFFHIASSLTYASPNLLR